MAVMALFGLVILGLVLFSVFKLMSGLGKANAERDRLLREGVQCPARLLNVQMGGMVMTVGVHRHLQLQLQLEVQLPGRPPHRTMLTTMVSELQVPQLQPGAQLTVRVDRMDPNKVALEGVGAPAGSFGAPAMGGYGAPPGVGAPGGYGAPLAGYGSPGAFGAPPVGYGAPGAFGAPAAFHAPGMVAIGGAPRIPTGAKIGMWVGIGGALLGVMVAVAVVMVNVDGVGLDSAGEGDSVCARAVRCCEAAAGTNASAANCKNLGKIGVPASACEQSLQSFREAASMQGRSCK